MRSTAVLLIFAFVALTACASQETMAKNARISMQQAVRTAEASVPGAKAKETHLETEGGRTVYEVELVDNSNNSRTVWVDAQNGRIVKTDK
ncbi:PepSY domain-containing protein [Nitrospira sp. Nam74]